MIKDLLDDAKSKLKKLSEDFIREVNKFRTGRASTAALEGINVEYYGSPTPISQVATISVPDPNLIVIQPWDRTIINDVERAIRNSNVDLNPISDGKVLKLPVPPLDQQRRMDIVKTLRKYTEERKTAIRNLRREYRDMIKLMKDDKEISEDDEKRAYDDLQKVIDDHVKHLDDIQKNKEKHILED